jgi:crossover junction endodeoxyribonuclease RuvC
VAELRIAGFDPGNARTGYAILDSDGRSFRLVEAGLFSTESGETAERRLASIARDVGAVLKKHRPQSTAVEELFFSKNTKTAMRVAEARGVILAAIADAGLSAAEYGPGTVKQQLTGFGKASKEQVSMMACKLTGLKEAPKPDDVTDAIAIAICHASRFKLAALSRD